MNIASNYNSSVVAVALATEDICQKGCVVVYDLTTGQKTTQFSVRYDFGGRRLSIHRNDRIVFVGCYNAYGLAAYSNESGEELWRRKDLKAVQRVAAFPYADILFCGREGAGHLLCSETGRTLEKIRGVKTVYPSPFGPHFMIGAAALDVHSPFGKRIGRIQRTSFAELDCSFSNAELLVTESGEPIRCFDLSSFELLWTHSPKPGSHFLRVCFSDRLDCFIGIRWHYKDHTDPLTRIVHFERRTGNVLRELSLRTPMQFEFCRGGAGFLTSDFELLNSENGEVIHKLK